MMNNRMPLTIIPEKKMRMRPTPKPICGIPASLRRYADKIQSIDDERGIDNGWWVNLKNGFIDTESGCHSIHEDTLSMCAAKMQFVEPCGCEDCTR